jgi:hypothetical protein
MAKRTRVELVDDITGDVVDDGSGETVTFSVRGVDYELDLADKQAEKFYTTLQFYVDHARRVGGRKQRTSAATGSTSPTATRDHDPKLVRSWAIANNIDVPLRGRIPVTVLEQYQAAN